MSDSLVVAWTVCCCVPPRDWLCCHQHTAIYRHPHTVLPPPYCYIATMLPPPYCYIATHILCCHHHTALSSYCYIKLLCWHHLAISPPYILVLLHQHHTATFTALLHCHHLPHRHPLHWRHHLMLQLCGGCILPTLDKDQDFRGISTIR